MSAYEKPACGRAAILPLVDASADPVLQLRPPEIETLSGIYFCMSIVGGYRRPAIGYIGQSGDCRVRPWSKAHQLNDRRRPAGAFPPALVLVIPEDDLLVRGLPDRNTTEMALIRAFRPAFNLDWDCAANTKAGKPHSTDPAVVDLFLDSFPRFKRTLIYSRAAYAGAWQDYLLGQQTVAAAWHGCKGGDLIVELGEVLAWDQVAP